MAMDDIMSKLSQVLNDPQSMQQLSQVAAALTDGSEASDTRQAQPENGGGTPDLSAMLSSLLSSAGGEASATSVPSAKPAAGSQSPDIGKLMQIGGILANSGGDDKNVALLLALKPLLKEENQVKIDRLVKIFKLMAAYPLIRDSGLLGGDLFG